MHNSIINYYIYNNIKIKKKKKKKKKGNGLLIHVISYF